MAVLRSLMFAFAALATTWTGTAAPAAQTMEGGWHGNYFPNVELTTHDGKKVKFYDDVIRGKVVAINFIYTSCGDVCPLDTAHMRQVHTLLGDRVGKDIHFYSISVDPDNDTPQALRRYMRTFDTGAGWTFLTGKIEDIVLIQKKLGLRIVDIKKIRDHDTRLIMGNERTSQWIKRSPYDDPTILGNILSSTLHNHTGTQVGNLASYEKAGSVKNLSRGQYLYRTRCASCHTFGGGDRLGPDLKGVVGARDRVWLTRWIKEPNKMIAEKDPLAMELMSRYRNLPMPNLSLGDDEAAAVIHYMSEQDKALADQK
ncbi:MAG: c-type cytochrome [Alphaproteobacteria bacterium]|nr:c-type cytochrome [Alphaproteobacteria bacterium]